MAAVSISSDFWRPLLPRRKSVTVSIIFPSICPEVVRLDATVQFSEGWVLSQLCHCPLSLSSRGSLVSAIRVMSSAYLRLLIFLPTVLIPACASSTQYFAWCTLSWVGKIPWRRKWHPTTVLLQEKSHGQRSQVGYSPWGRKESDTTERLHFSPSLCM